MKNFMFNSNAKKKISITSALFSLLILFFALNCSFCGNFCSASLSDDNDEFKSTITNESADDGFNHEEDTKDNLSANEGEEDENENDEEDKKDDETNQQKNNEEEDKKESTETQKPKRKGICGFCEIC